MLRRVFQRSNVPVRGLAAQVVAKATGWATGLGTVTCSRPCAQAPCFPAGRGGAWGYRCGTGFAGVAAPGSTFTGTGSITSPVWSMTAAPIAAKAARDTR